MRKKTTKSRKFFDNCIAIFGIPIILSIDAKKLRTQYIEINAEYEMTTYRIYCIKRYIYTKIKIDGDFLFLYASMHHRSVCNRYNEIELLMKKIDKLNSNLIFTKGKINKLFNFKRQLYEVLNQAEQSIERYNSYFYPPSNLPDNKIISSVVDPYGEEIWDK